MAELADALASGASEGDLVEVRVFLAAYLFFEKEKRYRRSFSVDIFFIKRRYTWSDEKENNILSKRI